MTLLLALVLLFGQGDSTSAVRRDLVLQGTVTDETSALLPGAVVVLQQKDRFVLMSTNEAGKYSFTGLTPGTYQIEGALPPFLKTSKTIDLKGPTTADFVMRMAPVNTGPGVSISFESIPEPTPQKFFSWISDVPPWLPTPGSQISGSGPPAGWAPSQASDPGKYNFEFQGSSSVSVVAEFYREVMKRHGLIIESEAPQTETSYSFRARTKDGAHQVNLDVRGSSGKSSRVVLTDTWTLPKN